MGIASDEARALTVSEIIDQRPLSRFQIWTILMCGLVLLLDGFDTQCIGFLVPPISETLGIPLKNFGPVLAAGLIGLMISAMAMGPVADRWGRKWVVVLSTLAFGTFAMLTGKVTSFQSLVALRFLTGLGLGGAMANVIALTSEYSPKRLQNVFVAMVTCGMPLGALVGGVLSSFVIPRWGWRPVFYAGGILPFTIALLLIWVLPESVRFLTVSGADPRKIARIVARIAPELAGVPLNHAAMREQQLEQRREGLPVRHLFTEGRAAGTILLWIPFFMNLLILYFIVSWLPALLRQASMPISAGVTAVSLFSLGGVAGTLCQGKAMNAWGAHAALLVEFALSTLLVASLSFLTTSFGLMMVVTLVLGIFVQGAQAGINALSASFYPTAIRATGVGWALGVGRIGSIVGPVIGGVLLSLGWSARQILLAGAIPAACAAVAIALSIRLSQAAGAAWSAR